MSNAVRNVVAAVLLAVLSSVVAVAATEFSQAVYRSDTVNCAAATNIFTIAYTNDTGSRAALASVFAMCPQATNAWQVLLINNGQTNILVAPSDLNYVSNTIKYDGTGNVPLGNGGIVRITGTVATNAGGTVIQWNVNLK